MNTNQDNIALKQLVSALCSHIQDPMTLDELIKYVKSNDYSAEMALQHALLLLASVACRKAVTLWQPIETAPKDGTKILLGNRHVCADGYWLQAAYAGNGAWIWPYVNKTPTHWTPLVLCSF